MSFISPPRVFFFVVLGVVLIKALGPIFLVLAGIMISVLALGAAGVLAASHTRRKKQISKTVPRKYVTIEGVPGHIEWVTDIRQLEHQQTMTQREIKRLERDLLDCSPAAWIEEGEKAALQDDSWQPGEPEPANFYERFQAREPVPPHLYL